MLLKMKREKNSGLRRLSKSVFLKSVIFVALSVVLASVNVTGVLARESDDEDSFAQLKAFTDVLALVQKNYVEPVKLSALVEGAIKGMLLSLDPHSSYLTPELYKDLQVETKGEFGGLGIEITIKDSLLTVVSPIEDSPAARAGIEPGDQIIKINEEFTKNLTLVDAVNKMRGIKGTPITLSIHRDGVRELIPITVVRDIIKVKSVRYRTLGEGFGYVRLSQFQEATAKEFIESLKDINNQMKDKTVHGLVLDMRNNPGGLLNQAIKVSDIFLKDGVIVYTDGRLDSQRQKYYAHDDGTEPDFPMVILVNGGSASAAEIVAGALQDSKRALVVGNQTFGKGSVQTVLPMGDAALRLTTALYYTRSGRSIQAQGITPDVVVASKRYPKDTEELLEDDEFYIKEKDLPGAIRNPNQKGEESTKSPKRSAPRKPAAQQEQGPEEERIGIGSRKAMEVDLAVLLKEDPQLDEALRLLKTWKVFQNKPAVALPIEATGGANSQHG
jgi:carboxyl-terminal processing protease